MLKQLSRNRLGVIGVAAAVFALLLSFMLTAGAHAQATGAMSIAIDGSGVDCDGDECIVDNGTDFTLTIDVDTAPSAGYIGIQTQVQYNELEYSATADAEDEIVVTEDGFPGIPLRAIDDVANTVNHAMTAGTPPTFTASDYTGSIVVLAFTCTDEYSRNEVELAPYDEVNNTLGAGFKVSQDTPVDAASDSLLVHCGVPPTPTPAPTSVPTSGGPTPTLAAQGVPGTGMAGGDGDTSTGLWIAIGSLLAAGAAAGAGTLVWKRTRG